MRSYATAAALEALSAPVTRARFAGVAEPLPHDQAGRPVTKPVRRAASRRRRHNRIPGTIYWIFLAFWAGFRAVASREAPRDEVRGPLRRRRGDKKHTLRPRRKAQEVVEEPRRQVVVLRREVQTVQQTRGARLPSTTLGLPRRDGAVARVSWNRRYTSGMRPPVVSDQLEEGQH